MTIARNMKPFARYLYILLQQYRTGYFGQFQFAQKLQIRQNQTPLAQDDTKGRLHQPQL